MNNNNIPLCSAICDKLFKKTFTRYTDHLAIAINDGDSTLDPLETIDSKADHIVEKIKGDYILFLDDNRLVDDDTAQSDYPVIVTRTVANAIDAVTTLGCPNGMVLDYYLMGETTGDFLDWFSHWLMTGNKLKPGFWYKVISSHSLKKVELSQRMDTMILLANAAK